MSEEFTKNYDFYKDYDDMVIHKETELHNLGVTLTNISKKHLGYGTIKSLSEYVKNKLDKEK